MTHAIHTASQYSENQLMQTIFSLRSDNRQSMGGFAACGHGKQAHDSTVSPSMWPTRHAPRVFGKRGDERRVGFVQAGDRRLRHAHSSRTAVEDEWVFERCLLPTAVWATNDDDSVVTSAQCRRFLTIDLP